MLATLSNLFHLFESLTKFISNWKVCFKNFNRTTKCWPASQSSNTGMSQFATHMFTSATDLSFSLILGLSIDHWKQTTAPHRVVMRLIDQIFFYPKNWVSFKLLISTCFNLGLGAMSTTTCNVRGKQSDGLIQKVGPMKATIPMSSLLRPLNSASIAVTGSTRLFSTMSPPMRLISPDHNSSGHRSPGAINCYKGIAGRWNWHCCCICCWFVFFLLDFR